MVILYVALVHEDPLSCFEIVLYKWEMVGIERWCVGGCLGGKPVGR